jgi:hypothetical protein
MSKLVAALWLSSACRFHLDVALRQRELQALVGTDRLVAEDLAVVGVGHRQLDRQLAGAGQCRGGDDALGVEHVQQFVPARCSVPISSPGSMRTSSKKTLLDASVQRAELVDRVCVRPLRDRRRS